MVMKTENKPKSLPTLLCFPYEHLCVLRHCLGSSDINGIQALLVLEQPPVSLAKEPLRRAVKEHPIV